MATDMLDFTELSIDDKELFDSYINLSKPTASELTFTNFFMWRNYYKFRYVVTAGLLCVISVPEGDEPFAFAPLGEITADRFREAIEKLKLYFDQKGWKLVFKRVSGEYPDYFRETLGDMAEILHDRDNSDYMYSTQDLINLKGKKYDGKRNHINRFKRDYKYEYIPLSQEMIQECYPIMDKWCAERDCEEHRGTYCEKLANGELLSNFSRLGCKGALIKVNGIFEGFTIGEMLNDDTAVIHIEKANSSINGLYTFINQQFCQHQWVNTKFINREQDLGIEGLRKAKLSYNPVKLIDKYVVKVN